jgi:hypothetical protein
MKWIKLSDRMPDEKIDGERLLVYRVMKQGQEAMEISVLPTDRIKYANKEETFWMSLPNKPIIENE